MKFSFTFMLFHFIIIPTCTIQQLIVSTHSDQRQILLMKIKSTNPTMKDIARTAVSILLSQDRSASPSLTCLPVSYRAGGTTKEAVDGQ
jgi:hypothetical protein